MLFVLDVRRNQQRIEYLMEQKDNIPCCTVSSVHAFEEWPSKVFDFLEKNIIFEKNIGKSDGVVTDIVEAILVVGDPIRITCE